MDYSCLELTLEYKSWYQIGENVFVKFYRDKDQTKKIYIVSPRDYKIYRKSAEDISKITGKEIREGSK